MADPASIGIATAFAGGVVSCLSPCVLSVVPGYLAYVTGQSAHTLDAPRQRRSPAAIVGLGALFVLGFSTIFVLLGLSATAVGRVFASHRGAVNLVGGSLIVLFGLVTAGVLQPRWLQRELRLPMSVSGGHPVSAYLLGLAFGFGWTPCIGPILGAILTLSTVTATAGWGGVLLGAYALGLGLPFLLFALFASRLAGHRAWLRRVGRALYVAAGGVMVAMGLAIAFGWLPRLSYWLLNTFPTLTRLG